MKQCFLKIAAVFVAVAALCSACDPWGDKEKKNSSDLSLWGAVALCWGTRYNSSTTNMILYLYEGQYGSDGDFVGQGTEIALDLVCPPEALGNEISAGKYSFSADEIYAFNFLEGYTEDGYVYPSFIYTKESDGTTSLNIITGGTLTVKKESNSRYKISGTLKTDFNTFDIEYSGEIPITDMCQSGDNGQGSGSGSGDNGGYIEIEQEDALHAVCTYYGKYWSDDTDDYVLTLYRGTYAEGTNYFVDEGDELQLELLCPVSDKIAIPAGSYTSTFDEFEPFRLLEGYTDEDGTMQPSFLFRQYDANRNYSLWPVVEGTLYVSLDGDNYSLSAYISVDNNTVAGTSWLYRYSGPITFIDGRDQFSQTKVATKAGLKPMRRNVGKDAPRPRLDKDFARKEE